WFPLLTVLALWGCRSGPSAGTPSQPKAPPAVSRGPAVSARSPGIAIRVAARGGPVRAFRLPTLVEIPNAIRGKLPPVERVVGVDPAPELLLLTADKRDLLALHLGSGSG